MERRLPPGYRLSGAPSKTVDLGPLSAQAGSSRSGRRRIGVGRAMPVGAWSGVNPERSPDGRTIYRIQVHSPGARGIRLHFVNFSVGTGEVWVYAAPAQDRASNKTIAGPYTGRGPFRDGTFWTGTVRSELVVVEFDAPTAPAASQPFPPFQIDSIAHRWTAYSVPPDDTTAASCELDVSCYANWVNYASAVVDYDFMDGGEYYSCSGSMIVTQAQTFKPYLLSAHHCVDSSSDARSVEASFFYATPSCNGTPPDIDNLPTVVGASYLTGAPISQGDFALMLLNSPAPGGTTFLGWNTNDPAFGGALTATHHPNGSWTRISFGNRIGDFDISVNGEDGPAEDFYQVQLTKGITEPGSSGSPLLGAQGEIYGSLTGGPMAATGEAACRISPFDVSYGRFSVAYSYLAPYLSDSASSAVNGASFLSGGAPGMLLSIFGTDLASGTQQASSVPLPGSLHGTTATVNGIPAPLFYVSPTQVNLQVPYETASGAATVSVRSADGHVTSQPIQIGQASPGIFTTSDGTFRLIPASSAAAGSYATLFFTGQGQVKPSVADGAAPPGPSRVGVSGLPAPVQAVAVYVGGVQAQTTFVGIPYYLVGVTQVNFIVPQGLTAGDQTIVVLVGGTVSGTAFLNVQ